MYRKKLTMATMNVEDVGAEIAKYLRESRFPPVKDFKEGLEWFNVSEPLSFQKHLKGKVVLLDFFTYCCINCMHILPDLKEIEEEFQVEDGLVVIGVHSAKFQNEKNSTNILAAVQRYNIAHPVVNDSEMDMWRKCDVHCWPTLLLLGPFANPIVMITGEGHKKDLKIYIKHTLDYYKSQDLISNHKLPFKSAYHLLPDMKGPLLFPGKITNFVKESGEEILALSDSGNNRILLLNSQGEILKQIGSSKSGFKDANLEKSEFNNPQGLIFKTENLIYVADTDNHAIRLINLSKDTVETVAGTGVQGNDFKGGKIGKQQSISSPWDLVLYKTEDEKNVLIIAMAGTHQIWALFLDDITWWKDTKYKAGTCVAIAGSGREENRNNQYPNNAAFAQPSGLALCKKSKEVYIADSESSSIRRLSLADGKVSHVVGGDRDPHNLFAFGDKDGKLYDAKLQHSLGLGISTDESTLFVADTYNHKIKKVDISKNFISTLLLPHIDTVDGRLKTFREPAGLCASLKEPKLYIADTNNHCIKIMQLNTQNEFSRILNLVLKPSKVDMKSLKIRGEVIKGKPVPIMKEGGKIILHLSMECVEGLKLTEETPQNWEVYLPNSMWSCVPTSGKDLRNLDIVFSAPSNIDFSEKIGVLFDLSTCTDSTCLPKNFAIEIPLREVNDKSNVNENLMKIKLSPNTAEIS
ncbi:hypothetical protein WA026_003741 [Henosepilachna vigintioctopunctata]|uniref:Thioredoxin domain-containing protein n=1 Tax=Henosepilachna vigintioctopunctata TaxID=420089 RepID=A0AAW1UFK9_9CUCU